MALGKGALYVSQLDPLGRRGVLHPIGGGQRLDGTTQAGDRLRTILESMGARVELSVDASGLLIVSQ